MPSIVILTGNHLCHNPRAMKEAGALAEAGFDVEVLGAWLNPILKARDQELLARIPLRFTPVLDLTATGFWPRMRALRWKVRSKTGQTAYRASGVPNRWQFGYVAEALAVAAERREADLFIAHSEPALIVAIDLLESGHRVGVDMEDWYSEDLLPEARSHRPLRLLRELERKLLRRGAYCTCPSQAMSEALAKTYGCPPPVVVYNAFRWTEREAFDHLIKDRQNAAIPSIHWYSQTIGPGRGLEDLLAAMPRIKRQVEIHLRGHPVAGFGGWLATQIPESSPHRVFVHGLVPNRELLSRIAEHDIGFAGEMRFCRSRDLTVTNKIMEYLLSGLAVVASDTAGQKEVAEHAPDAVLLYPSGSASALAARLNSLLESAELLKRTKTAALQAAERTYCWERQQGTLLQTISRAMGASAPELTKS